MKKWISRILFVSLVGFLCVAAYDYYKAGFHTRPDMPEGAFSLSYKNGFRAILLDTPDERETRRYFGRPFEVPFYVKDAWSFCTSPVPEAKQQLESKFSLGIAERLEAVCIVDIDNEKILRGIITTVPKL